MRVLKVIIIQANTVTSTVMVTTTTTTVTIAMAMAMTMALAMRAFQVVLVGKGLIMGRVDLVEENEMLKKIRLAN